VLAVRISAPNWDSFTSAKAVAIFVPVPDSRRSGPTDWRAIGRVAAQQESGLAARTEATYHRAVELGADDPDLFKNLAYLDADS
jgi:hypothetical protein